METDHVIDELLHFRNQFSVQFTEGEWKALVDNFRKEMLFRLKQSKEERSQQFRTLEYHLTIAESAIFRDDYHLQKLIFDAFRVENSRLSDFSVLYDEKKGKTITVPASVLDYLIAIAIQKYHKKPAKESPPPVPLEAPPPPKKAKPEVAKTSKELVEMFFEKCFIKRTTPPSERLTYTRSHLAFTYFIYWLQLHEIKTETMVTLEEFNNHISWKVGNFMIRIPGKLDTFAIGGYYIDISSGNFLFPRLPSPS